MTIFNVLAREMVFYDFNVEADNLEHLKEKLAKGYFTVGKAVDGSDFEIEGVYVGDDKVL